DFFLGLFSLSLSLGENDQDVASFGLTVLRLVLFVVGGDFLLRRLRAGFLVDLLLDLRGERVELHAKQQVGDRVARARQELLEVGFLGELLALDLVELLLDFVVGDLHAPFGGLAQHPVGGDQVREHLLLERGVLLFALRLERRGRRLGLTLDGLRRRRFEVRNTSFIGGRIRNDRLGSGLTRSGRGGAGARGEHHPVVERRGRDRRAV